MKTLTTLLLTLLVGSASANEARIVVLGDSLSAAHGILPEEGWVALLQTQLQQEKFKYQVINASISGDTTAGGAARLPALLDKYQPAIVILELGANDGLRGLPLDVMESNLNQMIQQSKSQGAKVLLIGMRLPPNYGPAYTKQFQATYAKLAQEDKIALLPFLLDGVGDNKALFQEDGLHPTAAAQSRILDNVWQALEKLL